MKNSPPLVSYFEDKKQPLLPKLIKTRSGVEFDPRLDVWVYRDNMVSIHLNFLAITGFSADFIRGMKFVLVWYAENLSAGTLRTSFDLIKMLCRTLKLNRTESISAITSIDLINYRVTVDSGKFGALSSVLKRWHDLGASGVSADAKALLVQLSIKGNPKGVAVLTMDPNIGPFTDIELQAISSALNDAYATGVVALDQYLLAWLFILLGQRPVQYACLKVCDVMVGKAKDGSARYSLKVPRAKQGLLERTEFKDRLLIPQIGELLAKYAAAIRLRFTEILDDPGQAPLFPQKTLDAPAAPDGFQYHQTAQKLGASTTTALESLNISSERTRKPMCVNGRRFRYTIGTRAAAEGHGELIIAEILDHTDTQNVSVYVQSTPEMLERIDRAMAMVMAPMAHAFAGTLIHDESEAVRGGDPRSRIVEPRFDTSFKPMGNCGSYSFCGFAAPIACYTCRNFQPWLEGPHEAVLAHMISERDRLMVSADLRIASINDRTILAIAQVITQCQKMRDEIKGEC